MPGVSPHSAAQIHTTVGDISDFPDAARLASYAGLSPQTNQSGTSGRQTHPTGQATKIKERPYGNRLVHRSDSTSVTGNSMNENAQKTKDTTPQSLHSHADALTSSSP